MDADASSTVFDRFEMPPSAKLLGWRLIDLDREAKTIRVGFTVDERFLNPAGTVQGGFIAAMLDDTQGPCLFGTSDGTLYAPTIALNVTFVRPAHAGEFVGVGRVLNIGRTIALTEAELLAATTGELVAKGSFTNRVMSGDRAEGFR